MSKNDYQYELNQDLLNAINGGDLAGVQQSLKEGANPNARNGDGRCALTVAIENDHESIVRLLLQIKKIDINAKDDEGYTPLMYAAMCKSERLTRILLKHGANPLLRDNDGATALDMNQGCDPSAEREAVENLLRQSMATKRKVPAARKNRPKP